MSALSARAAGRWEAGRTTQAETRYGCFLPDLTGLARDLSAANLPAHYIRIAGRWGKLRRQVLEIRTDDVRPCMSGTMSEHRSRPGGRCVPRTPLVVILFEEWPPALDVEAEEYPRAREEPAYKAGRRRCRVGGPDMMVKQMRSPCPVMRSSASTSRPARWWRSAMR